MARKLLVGGIALLLLWFAAGRPGYPDRVARAAAGEVAAPTGGGPVDGAEARALVAKGAVLVDVRTREEFASRHLPDAVNIPVHELQRRIGELPRDRPVVLYCLTGSRSRYAAKMLARAGLREVYDLGPIGAW